jgi:hypothetical protein
MLVLCAPDLARAGTEEFSTFDIARQEEDDESLLDHLLTRSPRSWRDAWERSTLAFRTEQGCLTSGQWLIHSALKVETPLGDKAQFGVFLRQSQDDIASYDYLDLSARFPTRAGRLGAAFRPFHDKSRQDFALMWETGADTSALQVQAVFGLEDLFNNLWAFRQTRVGDLSEPYVKHPFEPALRVVTRHPHWRTNLEMQYLTPSTQRLSGDTDLDPRRISTLWGTLAHASVEYRAKGFAWEALSRNQQAFSSAAPEGAPFGDNGNFRRQWSVESAVRHPLPRRLSAEARVLYQDRDQHHSPPTGPGAFGAIDRTLGAELQWEALPRLTARLGGLYDRISVARSGLEFRPSYGTRTESRAYFGLVARFGSVALSIVEGIELDPEPYDVWGVHDKGFFHLQAIF